MTNANELENKSSYRFCKLCYGFAYVLSVAFVLIVGYVDRPTEYIDGNSSIIRCANGLEYSASVISSYFISNQLSSYDDEKATKLCFRTITLEEAVGLSQDQKSVFPPSKNYVADVEAP